MDFKIKGISWMENIYQKFEEVCQEVDDIVAQDPVEYFENRVQDVGDSMKRFYSGVVHELLPFPTVVGCTECEANSVDLKNNTDSSVKSVGGVKDNNKNVDEENPVNNFRESLKDSNAVDTADDQQAASIKHDCVNEVRDETCSHSTEVENYYTTQEEFGGDSIETSEGKNEYLHTTTEESVIESASKLMNLICVEGKEPLISSAHNESSVHSESYSVKSVGDVKDNDKNVGEENPVNNFTESLKDSTAIDFADAQQAGASIKHDLLDQVIDETFSDSTEVENDYTTREEVGDDPRETFEVKKENMHATIEETAIESAPKLMNLIPVKEKEPLISLVHSESYSGFFDNVFGDLVRAKGKIGVNVEPSSCLVAEENNTSSGEQESTNLSLFTESSDVDEQYKHIMLPEVSPATSSLSCGSPITEIRSPCFDSSLISESPYSKLQGSCFEIESCKKNSGDGSWCISDSSMVRVCCESSHVTCQILESQDGLVSTGSCLSMESNDESLISSLEFSMEDIHLDDDVNLEESCVFVDDSELYAVSCRAQKHNRSYKKRIQDAFAPKKRLAKEYEQIAIWYGDTDMEYSQRSSRTVLPFRSRIHVDSKQLQMQQASETEWELL